MKPKKEIVQEENVNSLVGDNLVRRSKVITVSMSVVFLVLLIFVFTLSIGYFWAQNQKLRGQLQTATSLVKTSEPVSAPATTQATPISGQPLPAGKIPLIQDADHILGNKNAKVILVEYSDFECPFCKSFQTSLQQAQKDYGDKIAFAYRQNPLRLHQNAEKEAEASECANELGGNDVFWKFHDAIFNRTTSNGIGFSLASLAPLAGEFGIDQVKFTRCLDSGKYLVHVQADQKTVVDAGFTGTPTTFVLKKNGSSKLLVGALPYDQVKQAIDAALQ